MDAICFIANCPSGELASRKIRYTGVCDSQNLFSPSKSFRSWREVILSTVFLGLVITANCPSRVCAFARVEIAPPTRISKIAQRITILIIRFLEGECDLGGH